MLTSGRDLRKRERPGGDNLLQHQQRRGVIHSKQSVRDYTVPPRLTVPPIQLLRCSFQSRCLGPSALRLLDTLLLCRARLCRRPLAVLSDADSTTAVSLWWLYHCCRQHCCRKCCKSVPSLRPHVLSGALRLKCNLGHATKLQQLYLSDAVTNRH